MWIGRKNVKKMPYLAQFLIIKTLYRANFEHASFGIVYQLLDSIVNASTNYKT